VTYDCAGREASDQPRRSQAYRNRVAGPTSAGRADAVRRASPSRRRHDWARSRRGRNHRPRSRHRFAFVHIDLGPVDRPSRARTGFRRGSGCSRPARHRASGAKFGVIVKNLPAPCSSAGFGTLGLARSFGAQGSSSWKLPHRRAIPQRPFREVARGVHVYRANMLRRMRHPQSVLRRCQCGVWIPVKEPRTLTIHVIDDLGNGRPALDPAVSDRHWLPRKAPHVVVTRERVDRAPRRRSGESCGLRRHRVTGVTGKDFSNTACRRHGAGAGSTRRLRLRSRTGVGDRDRDLARRVRSARRSWPRISMSDAHTTSSMSDLGDGDFRSDQR